MKFSIITCSYNNLKGLMSAVAEVGNREAGGSEDLGPTPKFSKTPLPYSVEHIIIDGGSKDGTEDALRAWELEDGRWKMGEEGGAAEVSPTSNSHLLSSVVTSHYQLRWVSEPDKGLYDALNKGLKMATGDIIGILHTDDVWEPGVLERVLDAFSAGDGRGDGGRDGTSDNSPTSSIKLPLAAGAAYGQATPALKAPTPNFQLPTSNFYAEGVYGDLLYVDAADISKIKRVWTSGSYDPKKWYNGWMPPHPALFVTRELAERVGEYRLDLGSAADYEWMLRAGLVHGAKFVHIKDVEKQKGSARVFSTFSPPDKQESKNVKNHGLTPFVRMRVGGQSNVSVRGRLKAHEADRRAWELNGLTPKPWTLKLKVIRKIPQWVRALVHKR